MTLAACAPLLAGCVQEIHRVYVRQTIFIDVKKRDSAGTIVPDRGVVGATVFAVGWFRNPLNGLVNAVTFGGAAWGEAPLLSNKGDDVWFGLVRPPSHDRTGFDAARLPDILTTYFIEDRGGARQRSQEDGLLFDLLEHERVEIALDRKDYPWIVRFEDLSNPDSARLVVHPERGSEDGLREITEVTLQVTDGPTSELLKHQLPWMEKTTRNFHLRVSDTVSTELTKENFLVRKFAGGA